VEQISTETALDAIPLALFLLGPGRRVRFANRAAREMFGDIPAQAPFVRVLRHPDCLALADAALRGQAPDETEFTVRHPHPATFRARATPLTGAALLSLQDISAEVAAVSMRSEFVANVSHELRSPLTSVLGFIETLLANPEAPPEERKRQLEIMQGEARRMNRLISGLLSLSRIEAEEKLRPEAPVRPAALLRDLCATLRPRAEASGRALILDCPQELEGLEIPGDADQLTQLFVNLVENALAHGGDSDVIVSLGRADSAPGIAGPVACVCVADDGPGIAPEHVARLTERFYRADPARTRSAGGTGLGLAIVKHIVARHRGRLRIESAPGRGARFRVFLPVFPAPRTA